MESEKQYIEINDSSGNFIHICVCSLTGQFIGGDAHMAWSTLKGADCNFVYYIVDITISIV